MKRIKFERVNDKSPNKKQNNNISSHRKNRQVLLHNGRLIKNRKDSRDKVDEFEIRSLTPINTIKKKKCFKDNNIFEWNEMKKNRKNESIDLKTETSLSYKKQKEGRKKYN